MPKQVEVGRNFTVKPDSEMGEKREELNTINHEIHMNLFKSSKEKGPRIIYEYQR